MINPDWLEKLASGKELKIRMDAPTSDTGMKTLRGVIEEQTDQFFSIRDPITGELVKFDIGDVLTIEYHVDEKIFNTRAALPITFLPGDKVRIVDAPVKSPDGTNTSQLIYEEKWRKLIIELESGSFIECDSNEAAEVDSDDIMSLMD